MKKRPHNAKATWRTQTVIERIQHYRGNISAVARSFGVTRGTMYNYLKRHPTVGAAIDDARETMIDNVESVLYKQALEGNTTALIFLLKTQGYKRGYTERERHEISGVDGGPILVRIDK